MMMSEMVVHKSTSFKLLEEIASQCSAFDSDIYLIKGDRKADAKDILDLVTLSLHPDDKIVLIVNGPDAYDVVEIVRILLN
ncbi:MAG TPA: HPr family phosphocarrier protein [Bacillota bacterium]|nr:HPr family phosphocarrier protein [Bacillota bacterium]